MIRSAENRGFSHIYGRNSYRKTSFFVLALSQPKNESNLYLPKLYFSFQQCHIELSESFSMNVMRVSSISSRIILQETSQEKASILWNIFVGFFYLTHFGPLLKVH